MSMMDVAEQTTTKKKKKLARAGQSACCAAKPDEAATSASADEEEPQGPLSPDSLKSIEDDEKRRDRQMELALRAGLSEAESEVVTELFAQAANNEDWLHVDGLKEMMRCALPAPPAARRLLTCSQRLARPLSARGFVGFRVHTAVRRAPAQEHPGGRAHEPPRRDDGASDHRPR